MTDYKVLTEDKLVQMTEYGKALKVVANFSEASFNFQGEVIPAKSALILDGNDKTIYTPKEPTMK